MRVQVVETRACLIGRLQSLSARARPPLQNPRTCQRRRHVECVYDCQGQARGSRAPVQAVRHGGVRGWDGAQDLQHGHRQRESKAVTRKQKLQDFLFWTAQAKVRACSGLAGCVGGPGDRPCFSKKKKSAHLDEVLGAHAGKGVVRQGGDAGHMTQLDRRGGGFWFCGRAGLAPPLESPGLAARCNSRHKAFCCSTMWDTATVRAEGGPIQGAAPAKGWDQRTRVGCGRLWRNGPTHRVRA